MDALVLRWPFIETAALEQSGIFSTDPLGYTASRICLLGPPLPLSTLFGFIL